MNRNYHNSRGSSAHAGYQHPRWRTVFIALVLMLAIGSANRSALAQGAAPGYKVGTHMETSLPKEICVGETGSFTVTVIRTVNVTVPQSNARFDFRFPRAGIPVYASSKDPDIASLRIETQIIGWDYDVPDKVKFEFRGNKAGTTSIDISTGSVSRLAGEIFDVPSGQTDSDKFKTTVAVKVLSCKFEVTAVSTFESAPSMKVIATINKAVMKTDAPGHYIGTGKVFWTGSWAWADGGCAHELTAPPSAANLQGTLDDDGQLVMDLSYEAQSGSNFWKTSCGGPIRSTDVFKLNPDPLVNIDVPVSSGLEKRLPQNIDLLSGEVLLIVVPVKDAK